MWFTDAWSIDPSIVRVAIGSGVTITTTSLPCGMVGAPYSAVLTTKGGVPPYSWSILGTPPLPAELDLDRTTGVINGTPKWGGSFYFTVQLQDGAGQLAVQKLTIRIEAVSLCNP
jgi:Putative Ig domain